MNGARWNRSRTNIIYEPLGPVPYNQFSSIKEYISQIFSLITSSLSEHYMILLEDLNSSRYSLSRKSREICLTDRKRRRVSRELACSETYFMLFRCLYKITQCTHPKATHQTIMCYRLCIILFCTSDYFTKGLSYSEIMFVHELLTELSLTPMHFTKLPGVFQLPCSTNQLCRIE